METETRLAKELDTIEQKELNAKYDHQIKVLLANKSILTRIMKYCVREYADFSDEEIGACIIGTPDIASYAVHDGETIPPDSDVKVDFSNTEDVSTTAQKISYDVRFKAKVPGSNQTDLLIINIEGQLSNNPGYSIENRMIYYLSRLISAQYGTEFDKSHYNDIQKVYSIWICTNPDKEEENTIVHYRLKAEKEFGPENFTPREFDLLEGIIIKIGEDDSDPEPEVLRLFNKLLSDDLDAKTKKHFLEKDFKIPMTMELREEVENMCNISYGVQMKYEARGEARGYEKGIKQGIEKERTEIKAKLKSKGMSDQEIDVLFS